MHDIVNLNVKVPLLKPMANMWNMWNIQENISQNTNIAKYYKIFHEIFFRTNAIKIIFHTIYFVVFLNIIHLFHMFAIGFKYITYFTIFSMFPQCFSKYTKILPTDITEMAALLKFRFAAGPCAGYACWADSHCYNAHCWQSAASLSQS